MPTTDYDRVEAALRFLHEHRHEQPDLRSVARAVHLSEFHFQRLFQRWAGISPKRFLQFLTAGHARSRLDASRSVLQTSLEVGLSGPGRLHDLLVSVDAVTPGEWKQRGRGLVIRWGVHSSPFGPCMLATTARGVCALEFLCPTSVEAARKQLEERWTEAEIVEDEAETSWMAHRIFAPHADREPIRVLVRGTNFQIKVWEALLRIPEGYVASYGDIARLMGRPSAARAVANAVAANSVAYLVPCHRVIRSLGEAGEYRWGAARKQAMLAREAARQEHSAAIPDSPAAPVGAG